jgi:hypothetical protein
MSPKAGQTAGPRPWLVGRAPIIGDNKSPWHHLPNGMQVEASTAHPASTYLGRVFGIGYLKTSPKSTLILSIASHLLSIFLHRFMSDRVLK